MRTGAWARSGRRRELGVAEREVRSIAYQMKAARFPAYKDLAGFELDGSPDFFTGCTLGRFATDAELDAAIKAAAALVDAGKVLQSIFR